MTPILAHGGALAPLLGLLVTSGGCIVAGLVFSFGRWSKTHEFLGILLVCLGLIVLTLTIVFFDRLVKYFA